ncbi:MAG: T9SS type A sorting domain-containing protein [Bacteroidota bacterium]
MKKHITLILLSVCFTSVFAQYAVRNHSFENWSPNGAHMWPNQWDAYDSTTTAQLGLVERRSGGSDGSYSLRMNSYQDGSFVTGAWLEMEDTFPFTPQAFTFDYIVPPGSSFFCALRINLYIYDSVGDVIIAPSYNMTTQSASFKNFVQPLTFTGSTPKSYAMDVKFLNINGDLSDYVVVDNIRFLATYTPPPPPPTGIEEINKHTFGLYPNPANSTLYFSNVPNSAYKWKITGVDGRDIQQSVTGNLQEGLDINTIPTGMYIIELFDSEGSLLDRNRFCKAE